MLDLTLLGCGGGMPMPDRFLSSLCIRYKGRKILIDCGEGTQVSMRMCNLGFKTVDLICITHLHGDHLFGLPGLLSTIGNSGREEPITIIGPVGIKEAVEGLMISNKYLPYEVNIIENPKKSIEFFDGNMIIDTIEADHTSPCMAFSFYLKRDAVFDVSKAMANEVPKVLWSKLQKLKSDSSIEHDRKLFTKEMVMGNERRGIKLSFVTDTGPTDDIIGLADDSDLFICEGTYGNDEDIQKAIKNKHMTFREAAILARKSNSKKLLLTHFSTAMNNPKEYIKNAEDEFDNVILGSDRVEIELKFN